MVSGEINVKLLCHCISTNMHILISMYTMTKPQSHLPECLSGHSGQSTLHAVTQKAVSYR